MTCLLRKDHRFSEISTFIALKNLVNKRIYMKIVYEYVHKDMKLKKYSITEKHT